jgi:3-hydroxyisobutyrate dehydrogenase
MSERIGFIGIGTMGRPMARNLIEAGYQVAVYDVVAERADELGQLGAEPAGSAAAAAASADVAITMVPSSPHEEAAVLGPGGVLEGLKAGRTLIEMSTIDPLVTRKIAQVATERGIKMIDAPVSGSLPKAIDGTLTIMVGGPKEVFQACLPILQVMGENIFHVGEVGMGETVKLCNNLVVAISQIALSEAFSIGVAAGADPKVMHQVMSNSSADCWALRTRPPHPGLVQEAPVDQGWAPGFATDLMAKDVGLALSLAQGVGATSLMGALARQLYGAASRAGYGQKDFSSVDFVVRSLSEGGRADTPLPHGRGTVAS